VTAVQAIVLGTVAVCGTGIVLSTEPLRQVLLLSIYGLSLAIMFMALQAPDVALSEIVMSAVGLPLILLAALRRIGRQDRAGEEEREQE
jgi:uncharacterized MnhB-related membrane protein